MEDFETVLASQKASEEIGKLKKKVESLVNGLSVLDQHSKHIINIAGKYGVLAIMKISTSKDDYEYKFVRELPIRLVSPSWGWERSILVREIDTWPSGYPIENWSIFADSEPKDALEVVSFLIDLLDDKNKTLVVNINPLRPASYEEILCLSRRLEKNLDKITKIEHREIKKFLKKNGLNYE